MPNTQYIAETRKLQDQLEKELKPLLDKLFFIPQDRLQIFKNSYLEFVQRSEKSSKMVLFIMGGQIAEINANSPVSDQILDLFFYLGLVESYGNCYVDLLVMLLISNGVDFHIESMYSNPRIRHVNSIVDLKKERVPLTTKLFFLRDNGIKAFSSILDSQLRNDIAHLNFELNEDKIVIRGKAPKDIVEPCYEKLMTATIMVDVLLHKLAVDLHWAKKEDYPELAP